MGTIRNTARDPGPTASAGESSSINRGHTTAKLFMNGRSQAVRLPKEFRFQGTEVRIHREGERVILEPVKFDFDAWFARLDALSDIPFLPEGVDRPPPPEPENIFDE